MKIRLLPLDKLFSQYIRLKAQGICARCGQYKGIKGLQVCHFHSRRYRSVRWDEENVCACCYGDHQYLDSHPLEKIEFFKSRLGQKAFDLLTARSNTRQKIDGKLIELDLKQKLKEMK